MKVVVWMVWGTGLTKGGKRELLKSCPSLHLSAIAQQLYCQHLSTPGMQLTVEHLCSMCDIKGSVSNTEKKNKQ